MRPALRVIALCSLVSLTPSVAIAQPRPAPGATAKPATPEELFAASADAYRRGDFAGAIELLKKVYATDPQPSVLYNMGRAYEGMGDLPAAVEHYKRFLAAEPNTRDKGALEQRITTLERQIAEREALEKQRDAERLRAEEEAKERARKEEELARAKEQQKQQAPPQRRSPLPWIVAGVGVAGVATGAAFGLMASSSHDDAVNERQQQKAADLDATSKTQATIANVAFIAGGVLVAVGVTWWVLDGRAASKKTGSATWKVGLGPGYVGAAGVFE